MSSRADDYAVNCHDPSSRSKAMLVCRVVIGRPYEMHHEDPTIRSPPSGYDCVGQLCLWLRVSPSLLSFYLLCPCHVCRYLLDQEMEEFLKTTSMWSIMQMLSAPRTSCCTKHPAALDYERALKRSGPVRFSFGIGTHIAPESRATSIH